MLDGLKVISSVLIVYIFIATGSHVWAGVEEGRRLFVEKGCTECHTTERPARVPTFQEFLKEKGPPLWYAGSKFRKDWLIKWLQAPEPVRPMAYNSLKERNPANHPALDGKEAEAVTEYLASLTTDRVKRGIVKPKKTVRGRIIFEKKLGCYGCHLVRKGKRVVGGLSGPTLVGAGRRLNPDWIYAFLKDQNFFVPYTSMPIYVGIVTDREMRVLSGYVAAME